MICDPHHHSWFCSTAFFALILCLPLGVSPDVAGVVRLHFGALSPARRASEVLPDVAGACKLHLGAFSPAPRAPQVPLDLFLAIIIGSFLVLDKVIR